MCADHFSNPEALDAHLGHLLNHATKALRAALGQRLATHGLTSAQWAVLALITRLEQDCHPDGPPGRRLADINAATLGAHLQVDRTTMSGIIRRLHRDGWITVREHPTDRRARVIGVTDKTRGLQPTFKVLVRETVEQAARGFSQEELTALNRMLQRVADNLRPYGASQ